MPSLTTVFFGAAMALAGLVRADYIINPDSVPKATRLDWCQQELASCPLICAQIPPGGTQVNTCDADTLMYGCVCGDGTRPNVSEYTLTLPYFTCVEWGNQCVTACGSDNLCAGSCRQDNPCGALNPKRVNSTSTTAGVAPKTSSAANQVFTGLANGGDAVSEAAARQGLGRRHARRPRQHRRRVPGHAVSGASSGGGGGGRGTRVVVLVRQNLPGTLFLCGSDIISVASHLSSDSGGRRYIPLDKDYLLT